MMGMFGRRAAVEAESRPADNGEPAAPRLGRFAVQRCVPDGCDGEVETIEADAWAVDAGGRLWFAKGGKNFLCYADGEWARLEVLD